MMFYTLFLARSIVEHFKSLSRVVGSMDGNGGWKVRGIMK